MEGLLSLRSRASPLFRTRALLWKPHIARPQPQAVVRPLSLFPLPLRTSFRPSALPSLSAPARTSNKVLPIRALRRNHTHTRQNEGKSGGGREESGKRNASEDSTFTLLLRSSPLLTPLTTASVSLGPHKNVPESLQTPPPPSLYDLEEEAPDPSLRGRLKRFLKQCYLMLRTMKRVVELSMIFLPVLLAYPILVVWLPKYKAVWWGQLRQALEKAGAAFIKFGQWMSTREDLFPEELCDELANLKSKAPEHSYAETCKIIKDAFGMEMEELCVHVERVPIASGSIAQVYHATLNPEIVRKMPEHARMKKVHPKKAIAFKLWSLIKKDDAKKMIYVPIKDDDFQVAIKVRHPWVVDQIKMDMSILYWITNKLSYIPTLAWMDLPVNVDEFAKGLTMQINLEIEAQNLKRFNQNFSAVPHITFPKPVEPYVGHAVLFETFEEGTPITHYTEYPHPVNRMLAKLGLNTYLKMLIEDNFIHADCHSENILVHLDEENQPSLIMLDVGLVTELSPVEQRNIVTLMKSLSTGDGEEAANTMLDISFKASPTVILPPEEAAGFKHDIQVLFDKVFQDQDNMTGKIEMGAILHQIFALLRKHHIKFECNYAMLAVSMAVVEGLARKLDPTLNLLGSLTPYLLGNLSPLNQLRLLTGQSITPTSS